MLAARLADPYLDARIEAAAGLVLRGDARGSAVLGEIRSGIEHVRSPGAARLHDIRRLLEDRQAREDRAGVADRG